MISILVTDYIQRRRGQALLFSFEYNLLPNLISNFNHYMDRADTISGQFELIFHKCGYDTDVNLAMQFLGQMNQSDTNVTFQVHDNFVVFFFSYPLWFLGKVIEKGLHLVFLYFIDYSQENFSHQWTFKRNCVSVISLPAIHPPLDFVTKTY